MKSYKKQMKNKSKRRKQKRMTKKRGGKGILEFLRFNSKQPLEQLKKTALEARNAAEEAKKKAEAAEKALQEAEKNPVTGSNPEPTNKQATMI